MPIYVYQCESCGARIEKRQSFSEAPLTTCENCSGELRKVLQPTAIVFKGSGFYVTDNRSSNGSPTAKPAGTTPENGTSSTETKTESAATPKEAPKSPATTAAE